MKFSKTRGYISIILLVFVSLLSISIALLGTKSYQKALIIKNNEYNLQSKYIADSYLRYSIKRLTDESFSGEDNLFKDLEHEKSIEVTDITYMDIPSTRIEVKSNYKDIESNANGILSKYNKIFYLENEGIITKEKIPKSYENAFDEFISKFYSKDRYTGDLELISTLDDEYIGVGGIYSFIDENVRLIRPLTSHYHYELLDFVDIGNPYLNNGNVFLNGTFYIEGTLNLHTNLNLSGIVISNSGSIVNNGYNCRINGVVIEIGNEGSFPQLNIKNGDGFVNLYIKYLKSAIYKEVLGITINNE